MKLSAETLYLSERLGDEAAIRLLGEAGFDCADYTMSHMTQANHPLNGPKGRDYALQLHKWADAAGVTFNQAHAPFAFRWEEPGMLEREAVPCIGRAIEMASIMGVDLIVVHPLHHLNYFHHMQETWDSNVAFYQMLLPYAREYGVRIALENLLQFDSRGVAVPDVCADPKRYIRALETLDDPHFVACVDVGHAHLVGDDPAELIRALGRDRLKTLHIHDNCAVRDDHTLPYLGGIHWDGVMQALADIHYDGDFTFEGMGFYSHFQDDFLPTAARWLREMGEYLRGKFDRCRQRG